MSHDTGVPCALVVGCCAQVPHVRAKGLSPSAAGKAVCQCLSQGIALRWTESLLVQGHTLFGGSSHPGSRNIKSPLPSPDRGQLSSAVLAPECPEGWPDRVPAPQLASPSAQSHLLPFLPGDLTKPPLQVTGHLSHPLPVCFPGATTFETRSQ